MRKHNVNDIWVISDLHFSDPDMIRRDRHGKRLREFDTTDEMDEHIIERFNSVVRPGSKVYILGDMGHNLHKGGIANRERWLALMRRLHGSKRMMGGNHDEADAKFYREACARVQSYRRFDEPNLTMWLSHIPLHPRSINPKPGTAVINVHGHMHVGEIRNPQYINVCAERIDYIPLHYDLLMDKARMLLEEIAA